MKGFGGMNLMKQAQKMKEEMEKAKQELENSEVTASVANGMVKIVMNGKKQIKSIDIKKEAVDPEDVEMLEDLVKAAFNEAIEKVEKLEKDKLGSAGMPAGMQGLF